MQTVTQAITNIKQSVNKGSQTKIQTKKSKIDITQTIIQGETQAIAQSVKHRSKQRPDKKNHTKNHAKNQTENHTPEIMLTFAKLNKSETIIFLPYS